ncbi:hypothetical protein PSACC_00118 [Paramicrosporidium saccamoebae]|uniref:DNA polymerase kappa n=1 Tax=Paramicrosporidium saccamoebae TaxID=1246581 RepID=A0A2H9TQP5_9FUNG|nr:hypothetical protein PSACC_00118 [Paramicrosporidium saccamoebae]
MSGVNTTFLGGHATKSGLPEARDRTQIDKIIQEASKGSKFYAFQQRREQRIAEKVAALQIKKTQLSTGYSKAEQETRKWLADAESRRILERTYLHIDMDAFFAAVEVLRRPELATVPMAVGGESMLSTSNYVARTFGVVAAMPGYIARKLCPHLIIIPPDYTAYRAAGAKVHEVLRSYDPNMSSFSLDEASLDITDYLARSSATPEEVTEELRGRVLRASNLTCSAGVGCSRQLAKIGSNVNKPNGQFILPPDPEKILEFLKKQPVKRINGIGKVTAKILEDLLKVVTCADIISQATWIRLLFSEIQSEFLLLSALGMGSAFGDGDGSERKSMSVERTFKKIDALSDMQVVLKKLCKRLAEDLLEEEWAGKTVSIKMKTAAFDTLTRAVTLENPVSTDEEIYKHASKLLSKNKPPDLRLLGVRLSGLTTDAPRYRCLDDFAHEPVERPSCPVCTQSIDAHPDDTLRINEHIDKCLVPQSNLVPQSKKPRRTLDAFFNKSGPL